MESDSIPCYVLKHCLHLTCSANTAYSPVLRISSHLEVFMKNVFLFTNGISILVVYEANLMFKPSARLPTLNVRLHL